MYLDRSVELGCPLGLFEKGKRLIEAQTEDEKSLGYHFIR